MIIGFTGTRNGLSVHQRRALMSELTRHRPTVFVHGDCIGADADAHGLVIDHELPIKIVIRPCDFPGMRAHCKGATITHRATDPLARNRHIVLGCDLLIACPPADEWRGLKRGGTVYTIRYALKEIVPVVVLLPSGDREAIG